MATLETKQRLKGNADLREKQDYVTKTRFMEDTLEIQEVNLKQLVRKAKEERKLIIEVIDGFKKVSNYDEQLLIRDEATGLRR